MGCALSRPVHCFFSWFFGFIAVVLLLVVLGLAIKVGLHQQDERHNRTKSAEFEERLNEARDLGEALGGA